MTDFELEAQILLDSIRKDKSRSVNNKLKKNNSRGSSSSSSNNKSRSRSRGRDKKKEDNQSEINDIQNDINKADSADDNTKDIDNNQGVPTRIGAPPSMQQNPILLERRKSASPSLSVSPARTLSTCPESSTEDDSSSSSNSSISKSYSRSNTNTSTSSSESEIDYNTSYRITGLSESDTTRSTYDSKTTNTTPNSKARSFGVSTLMSDGTPISNSRTARLLRGEQMKSIRQEMMSRQSITSSSYISGQSKVSSNPNNKPVVPDDSWRSASGYNMSECGGLDGTIHPKASSRRNGRSNKSPLISSMTSEGGSGMKSIHTPTPCELYDRLDRSGSNKEGSSSNSSVSKETSSVTTGTTSGSTTESSSSSSSGRGSTSSFSSSTGRHSLDKTNHSLYDSSSLDRANRSMSTLTKSLFSTPMKRRYSTKHSKSTKKKNNLSKQTKKRRVLQRSPNSSLSSSQVATLSESQIFNYWESHRIGVVPGVEVSETSLLNSAKSKLNYKSRRNSFKDLLLRRETELDKERRKDDMIRLDGIQEDQDYHQDNYQVDKRHHYGEDTALVSYSAEYTLKDDKENQITKSMNRIIEDDPTKAANLSSHSQPVHTQSYIYFILFLSSMICILSYTTPKTKMSISTYSTIDKTTLSCLIISICLSFITSIVLKFDKTRRYAVQKVKLETSSMRIEFKSIVSLVSIVLLIVWTIISGIILFGTAGIEGPYRVDEDQISHANLYFSTWVSFSIACWLFADRCVYSSDPQPRNQVSTTQGNDISKGWILNFFCSILLVAFCESTRNHTCNTGVLEQSTSLLCEQLHLGVVFGSLGVVLTFFYCGVKTLRSYRILQSIDMYNIEEVTESWNRRVALVSFGLSILNILIFALNVEYLTSQMSARLGSEMGNIYICSWICFGVSVYLLLKHVDIIMLDQPSIELPQRARVPVEADKASYAGGSSSRIPLIHKTINCRNGSKAMSAFTDEDSYEYDEESGGWNTSQTSSYSSSSNSDRSEESEVSTITPSNMNIDPTFRQPNLIEKFNGHGGRPTYYYEDDGNLTIDFHGQSPTRSPPRTNNFEYQQQQPLQQGVLRPDPNGKSPSSSLESQDVYQILKQQGTKSPNQSLNSQIGRSKEQRQKKRSQSIPRSYPISKSKPTPPSSQSSSSRSFSSSSKSTHGSIDANFVSSIRSASWRRAESMQFEENELYQPVKDSNNGLVLGRRESLVSDPEVNLLINTLKSERGVFEASNKVVDGSDQDDGSSSNSCPPHNNEDTSSIDDTPNTQTLTPKLISEFSKEESKGTASTASSTVGSMTTGISTGPLTDTSSCSPITEDGSIEMFFREREKQRKSMKKEKKKVQLPVDGDDMSDISDESNGETLVDQLLAQAQQKRRKPKSKRGEKRVNEVLKQAELRAANQLYS